MAVWGLADLHLAISVPEKDMAAFGPVWKGYAERIEENWKKNVRNEDLVLIAGDISWASKLEEAIIDLQWIDKLPGTKLIIKGNHDYWWGSASKLKAVLPASIHFIQHDVFNWNGITIGGARLWDTPEYNFHTFIHFQENPRAQKKSREEIAQQKELDEKIFERELLRLEMSLKQLDPKAKVRIAMTHYPPIGSDLKPTRASKILEDHKIQYCLFGHLHNLKKDIPLFGEVRGVRYILTACDYLDFAPLRIF